MGAMRISPAVRQEFCCRLGDDWRMLADFLEIHARQQRAFRPGDEAREILQWLADRDRLSQLRPALVGIDRTDLAELFRGPGRRARTGDDDAPGRPPRRRAPNRALARDALRAVAFVTALGAVSFVAVALAVVFLSVR